MLARGCLAAVQPGSLAASQGSAGASGHGPSPPPPLPFTLCIPSPPALLPGGAQQHGHGGAAAGHEGGAGAHPRPRGGHHGEKHGEAFSGVPGHDNIGVGLEGT